MPSPELIWFICGAALILLEFIVPGVILVFFGLGAWIVTLTTYMGITQSASTQLLTFAGASVVLLLLLRRYIKSRFMGFVRDSQAPEVNLDEFTGKTVLVLEDIAPPNLGKVEFKGSPWTAEADVPMSKGERGVIEKLDGLTLKIRKQGE